MKAVTRLELNKLKRWPTLARHMAHAPVRIVSEEGAACYWKPGGHGYTGDAREAWVLPFEQAHAATRHCGPEKAIVYVLADVSPVTDKEMVDWLAANWSAAPDPDDKSTHAYRRWCFHVPSRDGHNDLRQCVAEAIRLERLAGGGQ